MTAFGANELLNKLMAHYPKDYFPGMSAELRASLLASFEKHFQAYDDETVSAIADKWVEAKSTGPTVNDILKALDKEHPMERVAWCHIMSEDEVDGLRELCLNGWTENGTHYEGPGVRSAYRDYTIDGSRDRISMPYEKFFGLIKNRIKSGYLI